KSRLPRTIRLVWRLGRRLGGDSDRDLCNHRGRVCDLVDTILGTGWRAGYTTSTLVRGTTAGLPRGAGPRPHIGNPIRESGRTVSRRLLRSWLADDQPDCVRFVRIGG